MGVQRRSHVWGRSLEGKYSRGHSAHEDRVGRARSGMVEKESEREKGTCPFNRLSLLIENVAYIQIKHAMVE